MDWVTDPSLRASPKKRIFVSVLVCLRGKSRHSPLQQMAVPPLTSTCLPLLDGRLLAVFVK